MLSKKSLSLSLICFSAIASFNTAQAQTTPADASVQKSFPAVIQVAAGNVVVLETQATGTLAYECRKEKAPLTTYKWTVAGPKAVLKNRQGKEMGRYAGPPATWSADDGSSVIGSQVAVAPNGDANIPLQLVKADSTAGKGVFTGVSYVQRVATQGGVAPKSACSEKNEGAKESVNYQADYIFWKAN